MIGNDIVDLALAKIESNWQRQGFLDKIFTPSERLLIENAPNPEIIVWNLWTRKEAAYKIYNRETGKRGYFPLKLECKYESEFKGIVSCEGFVYFTQTEITKDLIYTVAVTENKNFNLVSTITLETKIAKINGIPYIQVDANQKYKPVSITHHGRFWRGITIEI